MITKIVTIFTITVVIIAAMIIVTVRTIIDIVISVI